MKRIITYFLIAFLFTSCGPVESSDRDECAPAFERLLGISPPESVTEIRHAYYYIRDADAHWMTFTNDPVFIDSLIKRDTELRFAKAKSAKHNEIIREFEKGNANRPNWFKTPNKTTGTILYKEDYLDYTFSEFFLWKDNETNKLFLMVHYFD